ncbi:histone H2B 1 2-like protein [Labeo rohita]|uniref:Histone H2B 1 2-like protein n=1 Tax=Labeo rohita TaxID=84645 RepID=A0A498M5P5_LABRO|nr:histone H2B 1 2-like protein [Labeo rohita]
MAEPTKSAPKKGSKKAVTKTTGKGGKKRKKSSKESYAMYMYKILKQLWPHKELYRGIQLPGHLLSCESDRQPAAIHERIVH